MDAAEVRDLPARIETLLDELYGMGDPAVSARADELVARGRQPVRRGAGPDRRIAR